MFRKTKLISLICYHRFRWELTPMGADAVSEEKKQIVKNLYLSGIGEEFIALQLDLEIPIVVEILKELNVYKE